MQDSIRLRFELLEKLIPFFVLWNTEGRLTFVSKPISTIWGDEDLESIRGSLDLTRPFKAPFNPSWLPELTDVAVELTHREKAGCTLKGQIFEKENGFIFVGFPLINSVSELEGFGLQLSNLPSHDGFGDLLIAAEASRASLMESQESARELADTNEALKAVNQSFSRFVPQDFLDELGHESAATVSLGDHVGTDKFVMFADLRGFTTISEQMGAEGIFSLINRYLSAVAPRIREAGGYVCQYLGDGIMALFPGDSENAVEAAINMQQAMGEFNASQAAGESPLKLGIGIHFGHLALGIVGEAFRWDSTIISDAVNTASRVEGWTKTFGSGVLVTDAVYKKLRNPARFNMRRLGKVHLKGRLEPVELYEVLAALEPEQAQGRLATWHQFERAVLLYEEGSHQESLEAFQQILKVSPEDTAADYYRCRLLGKQF